MSPATTSQPGPPACLITGDVPEYRLAPFAELAERERVEVLCFGDLTAAAEPGPRLRRVSQRQVGRLVASGRYRAVVCGLGGRVALPAAYLAARRAGIPFVLWASIWSHPRSPAHLLSYLPTRALYRAAGAVVTYGPHVSAHVRASGRTGPIFEAPQAVDPRLFAAPIEPARVAAARERAGAGDDQPLVLFVGRLVHEKGVEVLLDAWASAGLAGSAVLALAGTGPLHARAAAAGPGVRLLGQVPWRELPPLYAAADVLVLPSVRTRSFSEPWGLVVNEAMHQGTPVIATDAVGAVAGGLVRDGRNGLVAAAGDAAALATRLRTLARNPELRAELGEAARREVAVHTPAAWAEGVSRALAAVGASAAS